VIEGMVLEGEFTKLLIEKLPQESHREFLIGAGGDPETKEMQMVRHQAIRGTDEKVTTARMEQEQTEIRVQ
jgi:hypothetical protein